ncbi:MAG: hypothetical protein IJF67_01595, partial [Clostridia bacterium]|nr:hypothetical protein [Clostridia bacterium]
MSIFKLCHRAMTLLLAASMAVSLAACGGEGGASTDTTTDASSTAAEPTTETTDGFNLPDKDWGGKTLTIMGQTNERAIFTNFEIDVEEENGDIV